MPSFLGKYENRENTQKVLDLCERNNFRNSKWGNLIVVFKTVKMGKFNFPIKSIEKCYKSTKKANNFNQDVMFSLEKKKEDFCSKPVIHGILGGFLQGRC